MIFSLEDSRLGHSFMSISCTCCGLQIAVPVPCGNRFCNICQLRRRSLIRQRIQYLISETTFLKGYEYKMLTLTIASMSDLSAQVRKLQKSFRLLRQTKMWKDSVAGGACVIEVTNSDKGYHAHYHIIMYCRWIQWKQLRDTWKSITKGDTGCYIQKIAKRECVSYLTKYLTKPGEGVTDLVEVNIALRGTRLFQPFGLWHGLSRGFHAQSAVCPACKAIKHFDLTSNFLGDHYNSHRYFWTWEEILKDQKRKRTIYDAKELATIAEQTFLDRVANE